MLQINYLFVQMVFLLLQIKFAPSQFLLEVSGTIGPFVWAVADVVQTLTLVTNAGRYGPFGQVGGGTPFHSSIQSNDRIVGFFGRGGMFVYAIGVYVRHFERKMVQGGKEVIFGLETLQGEIGNEDEEVVKFTPISFSYFFFSIFVFLIYACLVRTLNP